jgi:Flp pilus assembly protein CpaB
MNYKTLLITIGAILSIILLSVFAVQLTQNRAINLEETVETEKAAVAAAYIYDNALA